MRRSALTTLALAAAATAAGTGTLTILAPGGDSLWWLVDQPNNVVWTCGESPFDQFTIWVANNDTTLLSGALAVIAVEQNYNCNQGLSADLVAALPVGKGYTVLLTNINNGTDIYAQSAPFEVRALSAGYPPATATPTDSASATIVKPSGSASGSATGAASSASGSAKPSSASQKFTVARSVGLLGLGAVVAAMLV
ncbi:hypothetical protein B0H10DRAFT_2049828 [Mycena sp. CBHHK59/15]|nr:hypothetical protein B0H10DRAFT_2049828 [Mycena sp. CBHHK59/15]